MNELAWLVGSVGTFVFACGWGAGWMVGKSPRTVVTRVDVGKFEPFLRLVRRHDVALARLRERLWTKSLRRWYGRDFRWAWMEEVRIRDAPRLWFSLIDPCDHCGAVSVPIAEVYKCRVYARRHVENCPSSYLGAELTMRIDSPSAKVESVLTDW